MFTKNTISQSIIDTVNGILAEEDKKALLLEPEKKTPFAKSYKPSNSVKEDAEELDELSKKTLGSYINKAVGTDPHRGTKSSVVNSVRAANSARADYMQGGSDMDSLDKKVTAADKNFSNRLSGIKSATRKLAKEEGELKGKQSKLDKNHNGKLDAEDFKIIRKEEKEISFTGSHQAKTTLKNIKNPSVQQRMAAHDIKPGIAGYRDRIDMYKDAEHKGNLKSEEKEISFTGSHQGKTTLGHIKNPTVQQRMAAHDIKPGIKGYRDRIAMYKDAEHMGNLKSEEKGEGSHEDDKQDKALFKKMYKKAEKQDDKSEKEMSEERQLSPKEGAEKERIAKGMKKSASGFKARYGNRAKSVMYATATKLAKEQVEYIDEDEEMTQNTKEQVVTVKHEDSGKELRIVKTAVPDYQKRGYYPVKEEVELDEAREYLAVHPKTDKVEHVSDSAEKRDEFIKSKGNMHKAAQGMAGQKKVGDKYMREDIEELDELNKDTLYSYARKSEKDQDNQFGKIGKALRDKDPETGNKAGHKFSMRSIGQNRAEKRLEKEEVEGLDELNDTEESATINKNTKTVDDLGGRKKVPATFDNEHKSYKVKLETVAEGKGPETDSVPFVKNANTSSSPMGLAKELAQKSFKKIRNETMIGTASATSEEKKK